MKKLFLLLFIFSSIVSKAQNTTISFGEVDECNLTEVYLPIKIDATDSIGSISLAFSFDTAKADFIEIANLHPVFSQSGWNGSHFTGTEVIFVWYANSSSQGKLFAPNDILFEVKYLPKTYLNIPFQWDTTNAGRCLIADNYALFLNSQFVSDSINLFGLGNTQLVYPLDQAFGIPTSTMLNWTSTSCDLSYHLELSLQPDMSNAFAFTGLTDTFYHVSNLQINTTYYWRVARVGEAGVPIYSDIFEFTTSPVNINEVLIESQIRLFPNPVEHTLNIDLKMNETQSVSISIINMLGQVIYTKHFRIYENEQQISFPVTHFESGLYQLLIQAENGETIVKSWQKL